MQQRAGFTLIELMICIAIVAILWAVPLNVHNTAHWLSHQRDYSFALRNARWQLAALEKVPYDQLPPRRLLVPPHRWLQLQPNLVPGSVVVESPDGSAQGRCDIVDLASGRVHMPGRLVGLPLIVSYRFYVADQGEAHTVPSTPPYTVQLENAPVTNLSLHLARGTALEPLRGFHLEAASGRLTLPASCAGRVVVADYLGGRMRTEVSGRFLSSDLRPVSRGDGPIKQLQLEESGGDKVGKLRLSLLRTQP